MLKLRINPLVVQDLKGIRDYIAEDNEEYAKKIIEEIYDRFVKLQSFPNIGTDLSKRVRFKNSYKYIAVGNYVIIYKIGAEHIEIFRVVNRYRDITQIFE